MLAMNPSDWNFKELRSRLDVMGFKQTLPVLAIPLVEALFGDLIKTTECLRDTKKQVAELLEEKSCWEMGVEPFKCDNSRLLAECNELHLQNLREREGYELRISDSERRIRSLHMDKEHLQAHNVQLQNQLDSLLSKQLLNAAAVKRGPFVGNKHGKKPFISTVRSGEVLPALLGATTNSGLQCTKCNAGIVQKSAITIKDGVTGTHSSTTDEIDRLQTELTNVGEQLEFYKRKVESRNREILRLNELLAGGRPAAALAKDCCYKDVGMLSQDIDLLQREKSELMSQVRECQDKMHDAMQRAVCIEEDKRKLEINLDELKQAALQVEEQANSEIDAREEELKKLQSELKQLQQINDPKSREVHNDKRSFNDRVNVLTRREEELESLNEKQRKKLHKMQVKLLALQNEMREQMQQSTVTLDEEKIRLKSERDFFQKEYLGLLAKSGSESEIAFLHSQIKSKDEELRTLRSELCLASSIKLQISPLKGSAPCESLPPPTACSYNSTSNRSDCVQAAIGRVERERDCARIELERMRCERDSLREKHLSSGQLHAEELQALRLHNENLQDRIRQIDRENRELNTARVPAETHNVLLKDELAQLKDRLAALQADMDNLCRENGQISLLNEQNERIIADYQSKLLLAERQKAKTDSLVNTMDSSRESNRNEVTQMRTEISSLRQTFIALEHEKDTLLNELDNKTERIYKLEYELKDCNEKRKTLEQTVKDMETQVHKLATRSRQRDSELNETSAESKTLRQQIVALKASRDGAIAENGRLTDKLSDAQVETKRLAKKLKECEQQVGNMKQQLHKYVQEVKRAEDLLLKKEKERDELLDHYHSLTHDQVHLEGSNHSLEFQATEFKRQIHDLECEICSLKEQLRCRQCAIEELNMQLTASRASNRCLERDLENAREQKVELEELRKELCDKLDVEKEKLNAELNELNEIRKKLEKECENLRAELQQKSVINRIGKETTEQILQRTRSEQQQHDDAELKDKFEMTRLRELHETTLRDLQKERDRCNQQERLTNQFEDQARQLRQNLAEDRYCQARTRAVSPRMPAKTL